MLGATAFALAIFTGLYAVFGVGGRLHLPSRELIRTSTFSPMEWRRYREQRRSTYERWARPLLLLWGKRLRLRAVRIDRLFLVQAGIDPDRFDGVELQALKLVTAGLGAALALLLAASVSGLFVIIPLATWVGYMLPSRYLAARRRARQDRIRRELPDFVGVLRAFVNAGVSLERAVHLIATQDGENPTGSVLGGEMRWALGRYGLGIAIDQALEEMAHRVGVAELSLFVGALAQGKRLGTGLEQILHDQELLIRMNQRNRATAEASRVGTKLLGVLAGVYLPEFVILIMIPLFWGIIRRAFG